jgi:hypothetical protein
MQSSASVQSAPELHNDPPASGLSSPGISVTQFDRPGLAPFQ